VATVSGRRASTPAQIVAPDSPAIAPAANPEPAPQVPQAKRDKRGDGSGHGGGKSKKSGRG
jgi:hypothetical protein